MRSARYVCAFILLSWFGALAHADTVPVDPRMDISDPECGDGCTILPGTVFTFSSNANGGGFLTFENQSDSSWSSLLVEATGIAADTVNATSNVFSNPALVYNIGDLLVIYYSGVSAPGCEEGCFPGIPNVSDQNVFTINLNNTVGEFGAPQTTDGVGGWGPDLAFSASANVPAPAVPEPATLTLMVAGLGTFLAKKKLAGRRQSQS